MLLRNGRVELDGSAQEAIARYHRLLAEERDPDERAAGLREYGSGEARIVEARLLGPDGEERRQFAAGEPLVVELRIDVRESVPPPRISLELRDEAGLVLAAAAQDTAELGWRKRPRRARVPVRRRAARRSPTAASGCGSSSATRSGRRLYHWLDDAARFVVYPGDGARGPVLLDGTWSLQAIGAAAK